MRATNAEGDTTPNWSSIGRGTTGAGNNRPTFDTDSDAVVDAQRGRRIRGPAKNVGSAVSATDADSNRLRYSLEGPGKDSFTIVSSSGQIQTRGALDYESRNSYSVTVKVNDGHEEGQQRQPPSR